MFVLQLSMLALSSSHCAVPNTRWVTRVTTAHPRTWSILASTSRAPMARTIHCSTSSNPHCSAAATSAYVTSPADSPVAAAVLFSASAHSASSRIFPAHSASSSPRDLNSAPLALANATKSAMPLAPVSITVSSCSTGADLVPLSAWIAVEPSRSHRNIMSLERTNDTTAALHTSSASAPSASPGLNVARYLSCRSSTRLDAASLGSDMEPEVSASMEKMSYSMVRVAAPSRFQVV
mmetsp:Transcript_22109/g.54713  ORF Transcript_22109/g.54713 Transcript_22109/m.54713 type:complete len:236 (-) Transcript_22109:648-1355(-)